MRIRTVCRISAAAIVLGLSGIGAAASDRAQDALAECRGLAESGDLAGAIPRCEEAVALDFGLAEAHLLLGRAHAAFAAPPRHGTASAAPGEAERDTHRRKAMQSYRRFLALGADGGETRRPARAKALGNLLGLYILGDETDEAILPYADELAREPSLPFEHLMYLAGAYERHERWEEAERFAARAVDANPSHAEACLALAALYGRPVWSGQARFDDLVGTLERCARRTPRDAVAHLRLATRLWDKAYNDRTLAKEQRLAYVERGLAHADNALAIDEDYLEAVVFKGLLLRLKAMDTADPSEQERLVGEANVLSDRAGALRKAGVPARRDPYEDLFPMPRAAARPMPSIPPPELRPPAGSMPSQPLRVGGRIKEPRKVKNVAPVYPAIAKEARVQGVVILECVIGADGKVKDIKVLRGIPLLDFAAVEAVRQWEYTPTLYEGVAVPVIMTITVNFRLS